MTIAIILPSFAEGGAVRSKITLAAAIAQRGHDVRLVAIRNLGGMHDEVPPSVPIVRLNARRLRTSLPALVRYLRTQRPDAVVCIGNAASVMTLCASKLARVPSRVFVTECSTLSVKAQLATTLVRKMIPAFCRWTYPWAVKIICVSNGVATDLAQVIALDPSRIQTIYSPFNTNELATLARESVDDDWFAPGTVPVILAAGRFEIRKDFPTLLQAFRRVRDQLPVRLVILGDGADRHSLEQLVINLGLQEDVQLPGWDPNPYRYMSRAALFVLSSQCEGLAGVVIEAMACGCPVVSTDCASGPREILNGGILGPLVPVGDADALAAAIIRQLHLPRETAALQARAAEFSLDRAVDAYLALLLPAKAS